jgi:hypothetical protein
LAPATVRRSVEVPVGRLDHSRWVQAVWALVGALEVIQNSKRPVCGDPEERSKPAQSIIHSIECAVACLHQSIRRTADEAARTGKIVNLRKLAGRAHFENCPVAGSSSTRGSPVEVTVGRLDQRSRYGAIGAAALCAEAIQRRDRAFRGDFKDGATAIRSTRKITVRRVFNRFGETAP